MAITVYVAKGGKVKTTVNSFERKGARLRSASGSERHKGRRLGKLDGCDHTSTKAPDPIRTPKLSVLGRE